MFSGNIDHLGNIVQYNQGSASSNITYNNFGELTAQSFANGRREYSYGFDDFLNLEYRQDDDYVLKEEFSYDELNRLTGSDYYENGSFDSQNLEIEYDNAGMGNIISRSGVGDKINYEENAGPHALTSIKNLDPNYSPPPQVIEYTDFQKLSYILDTLDNGDTLTLAISYGFDNQRRKSVLNRADGSRKIKYFFGDYEIITDNNSPKEYLFVNSPTGLCAIIETYYEGGSRMQKVWHAYTDHLGSLIYLENADNSNDNLNYSYDAWGNPRKHSDWLDDSPVDELIADRGYTGHEHLTEFRLINMNGRVYDPILGRFLSPDPYVQMPGFVDGFNRYAYCLNNPLVYTDPDGEWFWIAVGVGALIGSYLGGSAAEGWEFNPGNWAWDGDTWKGLGLGALIGAAGGAGFYYAAPALANTGFFAYFGTSGMIGAYTITGAAAGGAIGYGSGFTGGMLHSDGDWGYSHQSGMFGAQIGATVGSALGAAAGLLTPEGREWIAGMFSGPPTIDFSIPEYDPYSVTASINGSGANYQGVKQVDWSDPTATYYGTMHSFRHIYQGNENPYQPDGYWHVTDLYNNTPQPSGWRSFWGSMSGTLSVSRTYTNGVRISIMDYQYANIDHWKYNFIGGVYIPEPPPYRIIAHAPSYPTRGIISVWFDNISIYNHWLRFLYRK